MTPHASGGSTLHESEAIKEIAWEFTVIRKGIVSSFDSMCIGAYGNMAKQQPARDCFTACRYLPPNGLKTVSQPWKRPGIFL